ncbi:cytochrome C [Virgibacillus phasianinus]|uniref:Cytochrome C n=1 Tax=Virgibacillus phasianinus TaxID=2017483 RepID=A0A220U4T4_9BACI|nr:cytochrome c [Virgibacillus phasianinus]ASK63168.1 cytochrome C [Virgibacillus phasianinus]
MKKNPVIPFALIAVIGILLVIVISVVGLDQQATIEKAEEGGGEKQEKAEASTDDPAAIFQNNCISCHGADLTGGVGPDLTKVGARYNKKEIKNIILNGKGSVMPAGLVKEPQAEALAEWLSKKK